MLQVPLEKGPRTKLWELFTAPEAFEVSPLHYLIPFPHPHIYIRYIPLPLGEAPTALSNVAGV